MTRRKKPVWLRCVICGHTFKRKSARQVKCTGCGSRFTQEVRDPRKPCPCWKCQRISAVDRG